jgi:phage FluMu protein gp41
MVSHLFCINAYICVCTSTLAITCVVVRRQLAGVGSLLPFRGSRDWAQVMRLSSRDLYLLSYLAGTLA